MSRGFGLIREHHSRIRGEDASADGCHSRGHDRHELRLRHLRDERLDDERRLHEAHEDVRRGTKRFGARRTHGPLHHPRSTPYDHLHDAEVVQHRHEARDEDDVREDAESEECPGSCHRTRRRGEVLVRVEGSYGDVVRDEVPENEPPPLLRVAEHRAHETVHPFKERHAERCLQHQYRERELQPEPPPNDTPRDSGPIGGKGPSDGDQQYGTDQRAQARRRRRRERRILKEKREAAHRPPSFSVATPLAPDPEKRRAVSCGPSSWSRITAV